MRHASLFSGIGGFDLAAEWMGWQNVLQVEIDPFCQKVLAKNFPQVKRYGDIKQFNGTEYKGSIDILTGGFPCQPFSSAGKRKGKEDDRYLWPEMLRVIRQVQPTYIVGENVYGLINWSKGLVFEQVCADMENEGYQVQPIILPACSVNASHKRDRIWFIANSQGGSMEKYKVGNEGRQIFKSRESSERFPCSLWTPDEQTYFAEMVGELHGIPNRVDRIKGLGNAIVPQVAYEIFKAIEQVVTITKVEENG
jgi:DNA (cytosine-5)-methyltransferase 1